MALRKAAKQHGAEAGYPRLCAYYSYRDADDFPAFRVVGAGGKAAWIVLEDDGSLRRVHVETENTYW
jgi:hypothetical protein